MNNQNRFEAFMGHCFERVLLSVETKVPSAQRSDVNSKRNPCG